jgi:hypothetical protein
MKHKIKIVSLLVTVALVFTVVSFSGILKAGTNESTVTTETNIVVYDGISNDRKYLSCTSDGTKVDLFNVDDKSGRQMWKLVKVPGLTGVYNIIVSNGVSNDRKYLSCISDGTKVDLFNVDDKSGRQMWKLVKVPGLPGVYNIIVYGGIKDRSYLSCTSDGFKVDLWYNDDESGRQRWKLETKRVVTNMKYDTSGDNIVKKAPESVDEIDCDNSSKSAVGHQNVSFSKTVTTSQNWSFSNATTNGLSLSLEMSVGVPLISVSGNVTTSVEKTFTYENGKTISQEVTKSWNNTIDIPPRTHARAIASITQAVLNIPFSATITTYFLDGTQSSEVVNGIYSGVDYSSLKVKIKDVKNGKTL